MSDSLKLGVMIIVGVLLASAVLKLALGLLSAVMPIAIMIGIGLILYRIISGRKSLGGGRRYLP